MTYGRLFRKNSRRLQTGIIWLREATERLTFCIIWAKASGKTIPAKRLSPGRLPLNLTKLTRNTDGSLIRQDTVSCVKRILLRTVSS